MNSTHALVSAFARGLCRAALASFVLLAASCAKVYVSQPVGSRPHVLEKSAWAGTWICEHDVARVTVLDPANGVLRLALTQERDAHVRLETYTVYIREEGDWLIASLRDDQEPVDRYVWARIKLEDDQLIAWAPDLPKFRALVRDQRLPGKIDGDDVALGPLTPADLQALTSGALGVPLAWDNPGLARRVAR